MAELIELSSCTFGLVPESKLSHKPQAQYGFVPKLIHHSGKNNKKISRLLFTNVNGRTRFWGFCQNLECVHVTCLFFQVISFTLVTDWSKIV